MSELKWPQQYFIVPWDLFTTHLTTFEPQIVDQGLHEYLDSLVPDRVVVERESAQAGHVVRVDGPIPQ